VLTAFCFALLPFGLLTASLCCLLHFFQKLSSRTISDALWSIKTIHSFSCIQQFNHFVNDGPFFASKGCFFGALF
jgi:hypothetical protein